VTFKLSQRSLDRLEGVDERMVSLAKYAIGITKVDFGIPHLGGLRTMEQQRQLVDKGASQTMKSKHLEGIAIDTVAYIGSRVSWELNLYDDIANAIQQAAKDLGISVRWGAAWHIDSIANFEGTMENAMNEYIDLRRSQGRRPFIDAPHFELTN
jgi:peptidoglycan L-alanyl-D-glutamate endopeptidase CwlK